MYLPFFIWIDFVIDYVTIINYALYPWIMVGMTDV